jgi:hypothetical protein
MAKKPIPRPDMVAKADAERAIATLEQAVKFLPTDYTVEFITGKLRDNEYYVPDYQRELVWKPDDQSRFIESLLMGLPIPFLFLWQADDGRLEIVDGSQRMRTMLRFMDDELVLTKMDLLPELKGFRYSDFERSRQRKFENRNVRGIVLDNAVNQVTRTEMFYRINTNDAEVRRGSLPGPFTELVTDCAKLPALLALTPISEALVNAREREELVVRFFTFIERMTIQDGLIDVLGWQDRPREYFWKFVKDANDKANDDPHYAGRLRDEFLQMLNFIENALPYGFRKTDNGTQVPRVRFEALSVGAALAMRERPALGNPPYPNTDWAYGDEFTAATTSDAANVKSKLIGRVQFVRDSLLR